MQLSQVVPWGRSRDEYIRMFSLSHEDLKKQILGCGDGPASFNAEQYALGEKVISVDPIYTFSKDEISARVEEIYPIVLEQTKSTQENYNWDVFKSPEGVCQSRMETMSCFLQDYENGKKNERYIGASFPDVDLGDQRFGLALCSHFLFLYSEHLDTEFHLATILKILDLADELRVFPVMDLNGRESIHLSPVIQAVEKLGYSAVLKEVDYEFRKGMKQMLKITVCG